MQRLYFQADMIYIFIFCGNCHINPFTCCVT